MYYNNFDVWYIPCARDMWWVFKYILYLFATVFVLNILIQLIVGNDTTHKVRQIKASMEEAEGFTTSSSTQFSPTAVHQTEIFGDWFGLETFGYRITAMTNIFSALLTYLDYYTQKLLRGIYADFVMPALRI